MTDRTPTTWTIADGNGDPIKRRVVARLHAGLGGGSVDGLVIADKITAWSDPTTGVVTFQLYPNSAIEPADSYWSFQVDQVSPQVIRYYEIPASASPVDLDDLTELEPVAAPVVVPKPGTGNNGDVVTVSGGRYVLTAPSEGTGSTDATTDITEASPTLLKSAQAVARWEAFAPSLAVPAEVETGISELLPSLITEAGADQKQANRNIEQALLAALGLGGVAVFVNVPSSRLLTAGTGLSGGGDLTADRTFAVAYGTTAGTAAQGNDSRLSDARTPTAHKTSHATGGSDALSPSDVGAVPTGRKVNGLDLSADRTLPNNLYAHEVTCWLHWSAASGTTPARAQNSSRYTAGYVDAINSTSTTTTGHYMEWQVGLDAGTWTLLSVNDTLASNGTWTIAIDGTAIASLGAGSSTLDLYSASTVTNVFTEYSGIVIPANGNHTIRFTSSARGNAGAGNTGGRFIRLGFRRTA